MKSRSQRIAVRIRPEAGRGRAAPPRARPGATAGTGRRGSTSQRRPIGEDQRGGDDRLRSHVPAQTDALVERRDRREHHEPAARGDETQRDGQPEPHVQRRLVGGARPQHEVDGDEGELRHERETVAACGVRRRGGDGSIEVDDTGCDGRHIRRRPRDRLGRGGRCWHVGRYYSPTWSPDSGALSSGARSPWRCSPSSSGAHTCGSRGRLRDTRPAPSSPPSLLSLLPPVLWAIRSAALLAVVGAPGPRPGARSR